MILRHKKMCTYVCVALITKPWIGSNECMNKHFRMQSRGLKERKISGFLRNAKQKSIWYKQRVENIKAFWSFHEINRLIKSMWKLFFFPLSPFHAQVWSRGDTFFKLRHNWDIIRRNWMMELRNRNVVLISRSPHSIPKYVSSPVTCAVLCCANYCAKSHAVVCEKRW